MTAADTPLHRFHHLLVRALEVRESGALERPFTVAEIYQDLVPYRRHRDQLGVEMNGDYEHVLLRLLAGEQELVKLESEPALREIRKELGKVNPNTGVYRDYAAADVRLLTTDVPPGFEAAMAPAPAPATDPSDPAGDDAMPRPSRPPAPGPEADAGATEATTVVEGACGWCGGDLPQRANLRFCPHCGADKGVKPCPACQDRIEPGWRYCISCGEEVGGD
jgi:hypothetical protein